MNIHFAPNNNVSSRPLFTGRTLDIQALINLIARGNCIALYGERRSGKTLTLEMLQVIVNGGNESLIEALVDLKLKAAIPGWRVQLAKYKALYVSLNGIRSEAEFMKNIRNAAQLLGVLPIQTVLVPGESNVSDPPSRLAELLDVIEAHCISKALKLVVLVDEMEILEDFELKESGAIAELFCDRIRYPSLVFVHTGSYRWNERVSSPGSLYTHLEPYYLQSVNTEDLGQYLLRSLTDPMKSFVIKMSGGKPLYAQYMAQFIVDRSITETKELTTALLESPLDQHIRQNIFEEVRLDTLSREKILPFLAHHPRSRSSEIATKLSTNQNYVEQSLIKLMRFGTIKKQSRFLFLTLTNIKHQYSQLGILGKAIYQNIQNLSGKHFELVGDIIAIHGRTNYEDPARDTYQQPASSFGHKLLPQLRWFTMLAIITFAIGIYYYYNPGTKLQRFDLGDISFQIEPPFSLESGQEGILVITISNHGQDVDSIDLIFSSSHIRYDNDGESAIKFELAKNAPAINRSINYYVLSGDSAMLSTTISMEGFPPYTFEINRRPIALRQHSIVISFILAIVGALIPGQQWSTVISSLGLLFQNRIRG